jgi:hypothetical protein
MTKPARRATSGRIDLSPGFVVEAGRIRCFQFDGLVVTIGNLSNKDIRYRVTGELLAPEVDPDETGGVSR